MLNGARNPPKPWGGSNLVPNFITYLWDTILDVDAYFIPVICFAATIVFCLYNV
jgi:hypothetical protein